MTKPKSEGLSRRDFLSASLGAVAAASIGCSDQGTASGVGSGGTTDGSGGTPPVGGSSSGGSSAAPGAGGSAAASGGGQPGSGGAGASTTGGTATTPSTGGTVSTDGAGGASGGASNPTGGASGSATGGSSTGGEATAGGGAPSTGGAAAGGETVTGGATATGGESAAAGATNAGDLPLVAMVRSTDVNAAVKNAIKAVGGFPDLTGKTVMLRPSAIIADGPPYTTGAEVVRAVIQAIKEKGTPASIIVAEDSLAGNSADYMKANGIWDAATSEGATCLNMSTGTSRAVTPEGATAWPNGTITCYEAFLDADYVVNMPVCKSHQYANYTMALKAWYGNQTTCRSGTNPMHPTNLPASLAELHLARKEDFVVLDATKTLLNGGPFAGDGDVVQSPGIIVASPDAVAADITGLCIMKQYLKVAGKTDGPLVNLAVWDQPQIKRAVQLTSLGWTTDKAFKYEAQGIDESQTIMDYRNA